MIYSVKNKKERGVILAGTLVFAVVASLIIVGLVSWFLVTIKASREALEGELALQISEAGIDYYRWHLAHDNDDYQDGQGVAAVGSPLQDDLILWLDAADINGDGTSFSDDTNVTIWRDKSPRKNYMKQNGSLSLPKKITDNGMETVEFTNDQMQTRTNLFPHEPVTDVEVFAVARIRETGDNGYLFHVGSDPIYINLPWGDDRVRFVFNSTGSGMVQTDWVGSTNEYAMWQFQNSTTLGRMISRNGTALVEESDNSLEVDNPSKMMLGRFYNGQIYYQDMNLSELLIYEDTLTQEEREAVEKYLDCKWDITDRDDCVTSIPGETYGPFVHEFLNKDDERIGEFVLYITAPPVGSTLVTVQSTGILDANPDIERTIQTQLAIPSFVKYAFASDEDIRFGEGTEVFGPIHSNGGVRFDGLAHNLITSSLEQYDDPDHSGGNEFGVHTHVSPTDPLPPAEMPNRPDVFEVGREVGVPAIDFDGMISDLADMKDDAQSDGHYFASSGAFGYRVVLKTDDTFDVYRVNSLYSPHWTCSNVQSEDGWGSWSVDSDTLIGEYDNPNNGVIFFEDHVWVEGQINTARLTIAAARFPDTPSTRKSITVNNDLLYTNYDGNDAIALIAQDNMNIGLVSEDDLRIDAAIIARSGRVGRYYYRGSVLWYPGCEPYDSRDTVTLYGSIGSRERYGFAWTDGTGYENRNIDYDANLLYAPPPSFPLTADQHEIISWEEIKPN